MARLAYETLRQLDVTSISHNSVLSDFIHKIITTLPRAELQELAVVLLAQRADSTSTVVDQMFLRAVLEAEISGKETSGKLSKPNLKSASRIRKAGVKLDAVVNSAAQLCASSKKGGGPASGKTRCANCGAAEIEFLDKVTASSTAEVDDDEEEFSPLTDQAWWDNMMLQGA